MRFHLLLSGLLLSPRHRWGELEPVPPSLAERFLDFQPGGCGLSWLGEVCSGASSSEAPRLLGRVVDGRLVYGGPDHWQYVLWGAPITPVQAP